MLLSHIGFLRLSSGHSGPGLTVRTDDAACASQSSPHLLLVEECVCATSPSLLVVVVRRIFCRVCPRPVMLPAEIPKLPTDTPMKGFSTMWKLLLHDSLSRTGLCP